VVTYAYRCPQDGAFDLRAPMGQAPQGAACPTCEDEAPRVFLAPRLGSGRGDLIRAIDRTKASADRPEVVSRLPASGRRGTPVTSNPLHRKLPRP
jgi:putative FmdB family regulatory protein